MDIFLRLIPYVRPHARKIVASWVLAVFIAALWGANFMAAWPLVKTLFDGKTIQDEVAVLITEAESDIAAREERIATLDSEIASRREVVGSDTADGKIMRLTSDRGRQVEKMTAASTQLSRLRWAEYRVLPWLPTTVFSTFVLVLGGLFLATVLKCVCLYFQETLVGDVVERTLQGVRRDSLQHALALDYATTSVEGTAGLMSRFTFDAQKMAEGLSLLSGRLVREPLKAIVCIAIALFVSWRLTLLSLVVVPVLGYTLHRVGQSIKRASKRMMESMARIYEQLEETLNGRKVVLAFNQQETHEKKFDDEYDEYLTKALKVVRYNAMIRPTSEIMSTTAVMIAMMPCAYLVLTQETNIWGIKLAADKMDVASVAVLYGALAGLLDPCTKLSKVYSRLKQCVAAVERIFGFLDTKSATPEPELPKSMPAISKSIEFREVTFQYPTPASETETVNPLVLDGLNLTINAGECVAIVGENGCGKSTLLSLLPRFHEPTTGEILIDGVPLAEINVADFRNAVGLVSQDTSLFSGSIVDNIRYGVPTATTEEVTRAADASSVTQFVENLPNGLETAVGVHGKSLSGGQRQRISLARAMIRDPKLLLLDEATSAIDAQSEQAIHSALKSFVKERTTIMVTHSMSPSILEFVTRIVVVANGRVEADGSHEKLLAESPTYYRLFSAAPLKAAA